MPSKIEWTDETWNPVTGCTKISPGCANCYAERTHKRLRAMGSKNYQHPFNEVGFYGSALDKPLRWRKRRRIFVGSMSDIFHEALPDRFIDRIFAVMLACAVYAKYDHTFMVLSKREARQREYLSADPAALLKRWAAAADGLIRRGGPSDADTCFSEHVEALCSASWNDRDLRGQDLAGAWRCPENLFPLPNVQLGVTVEDQAHAYRIDSLLKTPAAVRFVSLEPMLGPVDLSPYWPELLAFNGLTGECDEAPGLDDVICGGESGPKARPMHPDWPRRVRDDCQAAGVGFFFKQWGAWCEMGNDGADAKYPQRRIDSSGRDVTTTPGLWSETDARMIRVGKKRAGRMLDAEIWDQLPEAKR